MYRIDNATAAVAIPTPAAVGPKPNAYFTKGNPGGGVPATIVDDDWANAVQEELCNAVEGFGIALSKTTRTQLRDILLGTTGSLRKRLLANTNFYVRTDGNDSNNGLANTAGGAFLTLQRAADVLYKQYDYNGFQPTVNVGAGTFAGATFYAGVGSSVTTIISGAGAASTTINTAIGASGPGANITVQNMKFAGSGGGISANGAGALVIGGAGLEFGAISGSTASHIYASGGNVSMAFSYTISGSCASHYQAFGGSGGIGVATGITITLTGTPAFSGAFVQCNIAGSVNIANPAPTYSGSATGTRFVIDNLSLIYSNGVGISSTYFPGNAAGTNLGHGAVYN